MVLETRFAQRPQCVMVQERAIPSRASARSRRYPHLHRALMAIRKLTETSVSEVVVWACRHVYRPVFPLNRHKTFKPEPHFQSLGSNQVLETGTLALSPRHQYAQILIGLE